MNAESGINFRVISIQQFSSKKMLLEYRPKQKKRAVFHYNIHPILI